MNFIRVPVSSRSRRMPPWRSFSRSPTTRAFIPVFIYCASGNRAAALWMIRRVLREGWTPADAVAEAEQAGLKSAEMRDFARDYIRRHPADSGR